jgi:hypothetical protein
MEKEGRGRVRPYPGSRIVRFVGSRSGTESLTWSQHWIWQMLESLAPTGRTKSLKIVLDIPERSTIPDVLWAVRTLMERLEVLRTTVLTDGDGRLVQAVARVGELAVRIYEIPASDAPEQAVEAELDALITTMRDQAFATTELPLRVAVVVHDERPRSVVLVLSHLAADQWSLGLVAKEMQSLLTAAGDGQPGNHLKPIKNQPMDRARYERTKLPKHRSQDALHFWTRQLRRFPGTMFPGPRQPAERPRYHQAHLESTAAARALSALASRHKATPPAILLAATAVLLAHRSGSARCGFLVITANRFGPGTRDMVGPLMQYVPVCIDVGASRFRDIVRRTSIESSTAYKHGQHDGRRLPTIIEAVRGSRGVDIDLSCVINMRYDSGPPAGHIESVRQETRCWSGKGYEFENVGFYLEARTLYGCLRLDLLTDTTMLSSNQSLASLRSLERFLLSALNPAWDDTAAVGMVADMEQEPGGPVFQIPVGPRSESPA